MAAPAPFWPVVTKTSHSTSYPRIDPSRPELSTKGKNVVITGGGSGLGKHIARAFGKSGTANLALIGQTEKTLLESKEDVQRESHGTTVWTYVANIVEAASIEKALAAFARDVDGRLDVIVANAAFFNDIVPIEAAEPEGWWKCFEVNVKGNFNLIRAFAPLAATNAQIVDVSTLVAHLAYPAGQSSYQASKLAQTSLFNHVQGEHPEWHVVHFHPGIIGGTEMNRKSVAKGLDVPHDDASLPAHFAVWLVSPEAKFAKGKLLWAAWDVDELAAMSKDFVGNSKFTIGLLGWSGNA